MFDTTLKISLVQFFHILGICSPSLKNNVVISTPQKKVGASYIRWPWRKGKNNAFSNPCTRNLQVEVFPNPPRKIWHASRWRILITSHPSSKWQMTVSNLNDCWWHTWVTSDKWQFPAMLWRRDIFHNPRRLKLMWMTFKATKSADWTLELSKIDLNPGSLWNSMHRLLHDVRVATPHFLESWNFFRTWNL